MDGGGVDAKALERAAKQMSAGGGGLPGLGGMGGLPGLGGDTKK